jgi:hypothetical protein
MFVHAFSLPKLETPFALAVPTYGLTVAGLVRDVIIAGAAITNDEFDSHSTALRTHLDTPGTLTCQPLMWQGWGQVPKAD